MSQHEPYEETWNEVEKEEKETEKEEAESEAEEPGKYEPKTVVGKGRRPLRRERKKAKRPRGK
jgi:hypothetical protein